MISLAYNEVWLLMTYFAGDLNGRKTGHRAITLGLHQTSLRTDYSPIFSYACIFVYSHFYK